MGGVSLFADVTYEGGRSLTGPFMAYLRASAFTVAFVAGFGEFIGYGLRLMSGYISDKTGKYWPVTFVGFTLNLLCVPLLAVAGRWETAALLIIGERTGKAIRSPSRDAMVSYAAEKTGRTALAFGLHDAMDSIGALMGPLLMAFIFMRIKNYAPSFGILLAPALCSLGLLAGTWAYYPNPHLLSNEYDFPAQSPVKKSFPKSFWISVVGAGLLAAGYVDYPLIAYHFHRTGLLRDPMIPVFYSAAMGASAVASLLLSRLYERIGILSLIATDLFCCSFVPLVFLGNFRLALIGSILWGFGLGPQTTFMKAFIAQLVPPKQRATAFGIFWFFYGLFWFAGSAVIGFLYDHSKFWMIVFSMTAQLLAIPFFLWAKSQSPSAP